MFHFGRVLGHFEKPIFLELCKHMESSFVLAGHYVFRVGDIDDSIYVVQSGQINVIITDPVRICAEIALYLCILCIM